MPDSEPFFTENQNQFGPWSARFYSHGGSWSIALGDGWVAYDLHDEQQGESRSGRVILVTFTGANQVIPEGSDTLTRKNHYLFGPDMAGWITDVSNHRSIVYKDLWNGIDLRYRLDGGHLKYEFIVAPGSDTSNISMFYEGMDSLEICDRTGDLLIGSRDATLRDQAPMTYQIIEGCQVNVPSAYDLIGDDMVTFQLGDYDTHLPLVIDPGLMFSTFLGGSGGDSGNDIAVDGDGHVYVVGSTSSVKFPVTSGAYDISLDSSDGFLTKFSSNGSSVEYSTYIGGTKDEKATGVAVDDDGSVYIVGTTMSSDFPTTGGAFKTNLAGGSDTFALKLNIAGSSLEYSTYIGGAQMDEATSLGLDANGSLYIAGATFSRDFPIVNGSFRRMANRSDAFVVKLRSDGSDLEYSCVLGGNWSDRANALAIDASGSAYITGSTGSRWFPITSSAYDRSIGSVELIHDVFVTKISPDGGSLVYSTFIGDVSDERGLGIDVDEHGRAFVVGSTSSGFFPTHPLGPIGSPYRSSQDSFILKLNTSGHTIIQSRVLNLSYQDEARGVSVDSEGCAYVTGTVDGRADLPTTPNAFQLQNLSRKREAYVLKMDAHGDRILYASYLGGNEDDFGNAVALDADDHLFITGNTFSTVGFPITPDAFDNTSDASTIGTPVGDAFCCKLDISIPYLVYDTSNRTATTGDTYTFNMTIADNSGVAQAGMQYWFGSEDNSTNVSLDLTWGDGKNGSWTWSIDIPSDSLEYLYYRVWAIDTAGLNCTVRDYSILVLDNDLPSLMNLSPASAGTGNEVNLSVRVVDNIAVDEVTVLYPGGGLLSMDPGYWYAATSITGVDGDVYNFTIVVPWYDKDPLEYRFWANDTSGNWIMSDVYELEIMDDDQPFLTVRPLPDDVTTGQDLELRVHVRDYFGVSDVGFTWWFEGSDGTARVTLPIEAWSVDAMGNGHYATVFRVPIDIVILPVPRIGLTFKATDTSNNTVTSRVFWLNVHDNDPPWFLEDMSSQEATTGDPFDIRVRVRDNVDLESVWVLYSFDGGRSMELPLVQGEEDEWSTTVMIPHALTALHYFIGARDGSGNINWSVQEDRLVMDNDEPEVVWDTSDSVATTGDPFILYFRVEDNLFVEDVNVVCWLEDGEQIEPPLISNYHPPRRNGTHRAIVGIPSNAIGPLVYVIIASDDSANVLRTGEHYIEVLDNDPPWFGEDLSDNESWRGEPFNFDIEVWDNIDVEELRCVWWYGGGERTNGTVPRGSSLTIEVSLDPEGPLRYRFAARDASDNWKNSRRFERMINNRPPMIKGLEMWNVTEEDPEELDLRGYIDDPDDTAWVLAVDGMDPNMTLDEYNLTVMHEEWVPDYVIRVSVADGKDTTYHNITVHVTGVNDPPQLFEVMYKGEPFDIQMDIASFMKGRVASLTVLATDEEGDPLYYRWMRNDVEVATGPVLEGGNLPKGEYDLTLQISDGTASTSYLVRVSVTEDEQLFTPRVWTVLVVMMVVALLAVIIVRRVGREGD
jgi:hypothetical protein